MNTDYPRSADSQWAKLLIDVFKGVEVSPRGLLCKEVLARTSVVDMTMPIVTTRPRLGYRFLAAEAWWVLSGRNDVESIRPYSPHISSFSNDGLRFDGAYGPRIVDQLRYVVDALSIDPDSRQAVIEIWRPNPRPSLDIPCTISVQWMIRDGKLHCFDTMRSSDSWLGWPYDVFTFSMLSAYVALRLRNTWLTTVPLGNLYLTAASQHLYMNSATNVPYNRSDVEDAILQPKKPIEYGPLNLADFTGADDLVNHLAMRKDLGGDKPWLGEFLTLHPTTINSTIEVPR